MPRIQLWMRRRTMRNFAGKSMEPALRILPKSVKKLDLKMMYISTDYVFDGQGTRPWEPEDERHPLNMYGTQQV